MDSYTNIDTTEEDNLTDMYEELFEDSIIDPDFDDLSS